MSKVDKVRFEQYKEVLNERLQRLKELQEENKREVLQMFSKDSGGEDEA